MPSIDRVLETCLYVDNLENAELFYRDLFGFETLFADERICVLNVNGFSTLILFARGMSNEPIPTGGGFIPPHNGSGPAHFALGITAADYEPWQKELRRRNIAIESEVRWPAGGRSLYFRDPDNHLVELATPGIWAIY